MVDHQGFLSAARQWAFLLGLMLGTPEPTIPRPFEEEELDRSCRLLNSILFRVRMDTLPNATVAAPQNVTVKIVANDKGNPPGKLADIGLHFTDGVFAGLKLIGFAIWERRSSAGRNVTFPARHHSVNGERRSFALLRPVSDIAAQERSAI